MVNEPSVFELLRFYCNTYTKNDMKIFKYRKNIDGGGALFLGGGGSRFHMGHFSFSLGQISRGRRGTFLGGGGREIS